MWKTKSTLGMHNGEQKPAEGKIWDVVHEVALVLSHLFICN